MTFSGLGTSYAYDWINRQFVRLPSWPGCSSCRASTAPARSPPSPRATPATRSRSRTLSPDPAHLSHLLPTAGDGCASPGWPLAARRSRWGSCGPDRRLPAGGGLDTTGARRGSFLVPFSQAARSWWPAARGHHRPVDLSASTNPVWRAGPSLGTTRKHLRIFRLASTTHQFSAAEATSPQPRVDPIKPWRVAHPAQPDPTRPRLPDRGRRTRHPHQPRPSSSPRPGLGLHLFLEDDLSAFVDRREHRQDQGTNRDDQEGGRDRPGDEHRGVAARDDQRPAEVLLQQGSEDEAQQERGGLAAALDEDVPQIPKKAIAYTCQGLNPSENVPMAANTMIAGKRIGYGIVSNSPTGR